MKDENYCYYQWYHQIFKVGWLKLPSPPIVLPGLHKSLRRQTVEVYGHFTSFFFSLFNVNINLLFYKFTIVLRILHSGYSDLEGYVKSTSLKAAQIRWEASCAKNSLCVDKKNRQIRVKQKTYKTTCRQQPFKFNRSFCLTFLYFIKQQQKIFKINFFSSPLADTPMDWIINRTRVCFWNEFFEKASRT